MLYSTLIIIATTELNWHLWQLHKQTIQWDMISSFDSTSFISCFLFHEKYKKKTMFGSAKFFFLSLSRTNPKETHTHAHTHTGANDTCSLTVNHVMFHWQNSLRLLLAIHTDALKLLGHLFLFFWFYLKITRSKWVKRVVIKVLWINPWDRYSVSAFWLYFSCTKFANEFLVLITL